MLTGHSYPVVSEQQPIHSSRSLGEEGESRTRSQINKPEGYVVGFNAIKIDSELEWIV